MLSSPKRSSKGPIAFQLTSRRPRLGSMLSGSGTREAAPATGPVVSRVRSPRWTRGDGVGPAGHIDGLVALHGDQPCPPRRSSRPSPPMTRTVEDAGLLVELAGAPCR